MMKSDNWLGVRYQVFLNAACALVFTAFTINMIIAPRYLASIIVGPFSEFKRRPSILLEAGTGPYLSSSDSVPASTHKFASNKVDDSSLKPDTAPSEPLVLAAVAWTSELFPSVDLKRVPGRRFPSVPAISASNDEWKNPPAALEGQITMDTSFGKELNRIAQLPSVHLVLDIGAWSGGGSSWCIAQVPLNKFRCLCDLTSLQCFATAGPAGQHHKPIAAG